MQCTCGRSYTGIMHKTGVPVCNRSWARIQGTMRKSWNRTHPIILYYYDSCTIACAALLVYIPFMQRPGLWAILCSSLVDSHIDLEAMNMFVLWAQDRLEHTKQAASGLLAVIISSECAFRASGSEPEGPCQKSLVGPFYFRLEKQRIPGSSPHTC